MAQAEFHETLSVGKDQLMQVIAGYEDYPQFVEGCEAVQIEKTGPNQARVSYQVNIMSQEIFYTLDHKMDLESGKVEWSLVESNYFKKNNGRWEVTPLSTDRSDVKYILDIEFKVPVPGFILNRLVKGSLPGMVKSFEKRAKAHREA